MPPPLMPPPRSTRRIAVALSATVVAALASGCAGRTAASTDGDGRDYIAGSGVIRTYAPPARKTAPVVAGTTLAGADLDLAGFRGQVVVLNFWASWCPPCRDEADGLAEVARKTKARGVRFVGINVKDDAANARIFTERRSTPYPSLHDRTGQLTVQFSASVPPQAVPTTLVVDRQGRIAASVFGSITYSRLLPLVTSLAAEPA